MVIQCTCAEISTIQKKHYLILSIAKNAVMKNYSEVSQLTIIIKKSEFKILFL